MFFINIIPTGATVQPLITSQFFGMFYALRKELFIKRAPYNEGEQHEYDYMDDVNEFIYLLKITNFSSDNFIYTLNIY